MSAGRELRGDRQRARNGVAGGRLDEAAVVLGLVRRAGVRGTTPCHVRVGYFRSKPTKRSSLGSWRVSQKISCAVKRSVWSRRHRDADARATRADGTSTRSPSTSRTDAVVGTTLSGGAAGDTDTLSATEAAALPHRRLQSEPADTQTLRRR